MNYRLLHLLSGRTGGDSGFENVGVELERVDVDLDLEIGRNPNR